MRQLLTVALMALMALACQNNPNERKKETQMMSLEEADTVASAELGQEQIFVDTMANALPSTTARNGTQNHPAESAPPAIISANLVKKASLDVEVNELTSYRKQLQENLARHGGYVEQEQVAKAGESMSAQLTLKVPSANFEAVVYALEASAHAVSRKSSSTEEVSQQMFEAKARAISQAALRQRYMELIPKAKTTESLLEIEQGIHAATTEVELAKSRAAMLRSQTQYSTILINISPVVAPTAAPANGFLQEAGQALAKGWQWISALVIVGLGVWPLWMALGLGVWWWRRRQRSLPRLKNTVQTV